MLWLIALMIAVLAALVFWHVGLPVLSRAGRALPGNALLSSNLSGNVYIMMKSGDVKRAADVEVVLVAVNEPMQSAWVQTITTFKDAYKQAEQAEEAAEAEKKAGTLLAQRARDRAMLHEAYDRQNRAIVAFYEAQRRRIELVSGLRVQALTMITKGPPQLAKTDVTGRYEFASVKSGEYLLFTHFKVFDNEVFWMVPVVVGASRQMLDLSNSNAEVVVSTAVRQLSWMAPFLRTGSHCRALSAVPT